MRCRVLDGRQLTDDLVDRWQHLCAENGSLTSPYFQPAFTRAVAAVRDDVRVAVYETDGEVTAILPFQRSGLGGGRPVGGPLSDYQAVVTGTNSGWDAADMIRAAGLSRWEFDHLLCTQTPFETFHTHTTESPVMDLSEGFDAYVETLRSLGPNRIRTLGRKRRKLGREVGDVRVELECRDEAVLRTLLGWKSEQCIRTGKPDIFGVGWTVELVERILATHQPAFAGMLSALFAGDRLLAAHFGMRSATVWHYWFPGYDHEFSTYSPGQLLLLAMAEEAAGLGLRAIDLGKGDDGYKQQFRTTAVPLAEGAVELPSAASWVRRACAATEERVKRSPLANVARRPARALRKLGRWWRLR